MVRRRNPEVEKLIDRVKEDAWIDCPGGINAQEKASSPRTRVQEVPGDRAGVRCFVIASDERREYEQRQREKTMRRAREALAKVARRVTLGRLKDPAKIGAAVERALQRHYGYRYYAWELKEGLLRITEHPVRLAQEKKYEGKYLLQTDQAEITATEAVHQYKQLAEVERAFRTIKDPLSLHPINHRAEHRVRAHIFVAALAFLLDRLLERRFKASQTNLSTGDAWSALETIRHVTFRVQGEHRTGVTPGSSRARQVLKALAITDLRCQRRPDIGPLRRPDDRLAGSGRWRSDVLSIHRLRKIFYRLLDRITALNIIMKAAQRLYAGEQVQLPAGNRNDTWRPGQHPRLGLLRGGRWWFTCCNVDSYQ
jgi:hypothetical protein